MATTNRQITKNGFVVPNNANYDHYFTGVCTSGKRAYLIRAAAKKAAKHAAKSGKGNMRAYQCKFCNYWHVGHATEYNPRYKNNKKDGKK